MTPINIAVVGLGKIGLPLAVQYAKKGNRVFGIDTNEETVKKVNQGLEPFPGEKNLSVYLKEVVDEGRLFATSNYEEALGSAEIIVIATPLLIDGHNQPDFSILDSVSQSIGLNIRKGSLVILETTVPIGTTRDRLTKIIEKNSSFEAGADFLVAFSPERVFTGRIFEDLRRYPKLVGGIDDESSMRAKEFYEKVIDFDERPDLKYKNGVWLMQSAEAAEFAKLAETTYRDVNISLSNEFARSAITLDLDLNRIITACNSQFFSNIHQPGLWVGGHCIPVYPHLFMSTNRDTELINLARERNRDMLKFTIEFIESKLGGLNNYRVLILGVTYRGNVKEMAFSGAHPMKRLLNEKNARVVVMDPMYVEKELHDLGFETYQLGDAIDLVIVNAEHDEFQSLEAKDFPGIRAIFDGRRFLDGKNWKPALYLSF